MSFLEPLAVIFGILSVWFARKENILVFPFGIVSVLMYIYIYISAQLYANAGINVFFLLSNSYGWYRWTHPDANNRMLQITRNTRKQNIISGIAVAVTYSVVLLVLRLANQHDSAYLQSYVPYIDAFNTAFFLVATILLVVKKAENWWFWIIGDAVSIPIFISRGLYFISFQYAVFLVLAVSGWRQWKRKIDDAC